MGPQPFQDETLGGDRARLHGLNPERNRLGIRTYIAEQEPSRCRDVVDEQLHERPAHRWRDKPFIKERRPRILGENADADLAAFDQDLDRDRCWSALPA